MLNWTSLGSLSGEDNDGDANANANDNSKKAVGLDCQNNNNARASRLFVLFFAVTAWLQRETV